mmetsp:Transcript_13963/g.22818  ORF Transcript_13963/g.22818 Transcript_13963/m.22818 type:complete len:148 (-) Transcript_13963:863-1306(-)
MVAVSLHPVCTLTASLEYSLTAESVSYLFSSINRIECSNGTIYSLQQDRRVRVVWREGLHGCTNVCEVKGGNWVSCSPKVIWVHEDEIGQQAILHCDLNLSITLLVCVVWVFVVAFFLSRACKLCMYEQRKPASDDNLFKNEALILQ